MGFSIGGDHWLNTHLRASGLVWKVGNTVWAERDGRDVTKRTNRSFMVILKYMRLFRFLIKIPITTWRFTAPCFEFSAFLRGSQSVIFKYCLYYYYIQMTWTPSVFLFTSSFYLVYPPSSRIGIKVATKLEVDRSSHQTFLIDLSLG